MLKLCEANLLEARISQSFLFHVAEYGNFHFSNLLCSSIHNLNSLRWQ